MHGAPSLGKQETPPFRLTLSFISGDADMDQRQEGREELFRRLCFEGRLVELKDLCERDPGIVRRGIDCTTLGNKWLSVTSGSGLHLAASEGHLHCCRVLLDAGADVDAKDGRGCTPLMYASRTEHVEVIELLLCRGADVLGSSLFGWTSLHFCVYYGRSTRVVQILVSAGADLTAQNGSGNTPLALALLSATDYATTIGFELLKLGAKDVNARSSVTGKTLLHLVTEEGGRARLGEDIETLVAAGADLEAVDHRRCTPLFTATAQNNVVACKKLIQHGANANVVDMHGHTPLQVALKHIQIDVAALLIEGGASIRDEDVFPRKLYVSKVFFAAAKSGCAQVVYILADAGANVDTTDDDGNTGLLLAAKGGHTETVKNMIDIGAKVDSRNDEGQDAYLVAMANGHLATAAELIKAGANSKVGDGDGNSGIHLAAKNGHMDAVSEQVQSGDHVDVRNKDGDTPLHLAAAYGHTETALGVLKLGINIEERNLSGNTALLLAARGGHSQTINALLKAGANIEGRNNDNDTPFLLALKRGHFHAASVLIKADAQTEVENNEGVSPLILAARYDNVWLATELLKAGARCVHRSS